MRLTFFKGVVLGAVTSMLTLAATAALAGTGVGAVFNLGKINSVNATSTLTGSSTASMLKVTNSSTGAAARGVHVTNDSVSAAAIRADNKAAGPGGAFSSAGPAASFTVPAGQPPFTVNSSTEVSGLNAALLDGQPAGAFLPFFGTAVNSVALGGHLAADYQLRCMHGTIQAFTQVPASGSFSSTYTLLTSGFTCANGNFAKRVGQGDYRVLFCGVSGSTNPVALATDNSFNDFVGVQLVNPADSDAVSTCSGVGASVLAEFKVTTRDASGTGQDEPFTIAQLGT